MNRVYWYKVRKVGRLEINSVMGWQTPETEGIVLAKLKKDYGDRLAYLYYIDDKDEQVVLYAADVTGSSPVVPTEGGNVK